MTVYLSLEMLSLVNVLLFKVIVLVGRHLKIIPVLSQLKLLFIRNHHKFLVIFFYPDATFSLAELGRTLF